MVKIKEKEKDIQKAISDYLTLKNIIHWRVNSGAAFHNDLNKKSGKRYIRFIYWLYPSSTKIKGYNFLDLAGIINGGLYFTIEVKRTGELPSVEQYNTIDLIKFRGAIAFWADSVDMMLEKFKQFGIFL